MTKTPAAIVGNFTIEHDKRGWFIGVECGKEFERVGPCNLLKKALKESRIVFEGLMAKAAFGE